MYYSILDTYNLLGFQPCSLSLLCPKRILSPWVLCLLTAVIFWMPEAGGPHQLERLEMYFVQLFSSSCT